MRANAWLFDKVVDMWSCHVSHSPIAIALDIEWSKFVAPRTFK